MHMFVSVQKERGAKHMDKIEKVQIPIVVSLRYKEMLKELTNYMGMNRQELLKMLIVKAHTEFIENKKEK